jgi:hypothetical protein
MNKIAATAIMAKTVFDKSDTFFSLVLRVGGIVLSKFMISMSELAFFLIWTVTKL